MSVADAISDARVVVMDFPQMDFSDMFKATPPQTLQPQNIVVNNFVVNNPTVQAEDKAVRAKAVHQILSKCISKKTLPKQRNTGNAKRAGNFPQGLKKVLLNFLVGAKLIDKDLFESLKAKSPEERRQAVLKVISILKKHRKNSSAVSSTTSNFMPAVQPPTGNYHIEGATGECVPLTTVSDAENNFPSLNQAPQNPSQGITPQTNIPASDLTQQLGNSGSIDCAFPPQQAVSVNLGKMAALNLGRSVVGQSLQEAEKTENPDMDLIEILWRQDMDLGVGKEMYDVNLRKQLEKDQELELHKKQQQEALEKEKLNQQEQQELQTNITYIVDGETGELIPAPADHEVPQVQAPLQPQIQQQQVPQLQQQVQQQVQQPQQVLPQVQPQQLQQQQQQQVEFDLNDDLNEAWELFRQQQQQMPIVRQNSLEQRWDDVANLLDLPDQQDIDMAPANHHPALLQNATLPVAQANGTDFNLNPQPITVEPNDTSYIPFNVSGLQYNPNVNNSLLDLNLPFPGNQSAANVTAPPQAFPFNTSNDSFLTELLQNDELDINFDAMDLNGTEAAQQDEEKMDDASSDSAVSSMAGSSSPDDMYDRLSSFSGSNYHGVEGATGGHDDVFSPSVNLKKEVQDSHFSYEDFGFSEEPMASTSTNSSDTDFKVPLPEHNTVAEPRHVAHNHTYPLAPGQQPRERKLTAEERRATAQMTRDEKKCRAAKIPFTIDDIIHSPVDEFNDLLTKYKLSDAQLQLIRDVRRRGKNKVAAQNCRKRKMEVIQSLEDEVNAIRQEKERLMRERNRLHKGRTEMKDKYNQMYQEVFRSLRDDNGRPYDPSQFTLQHTPDGNVFLVPVNTTTPPTDHDEKPMHKRKNKKSSR